jgi:hypothetical protein
VTRVAVTDRLAGSRVVSRSRVREMGLRAAPTAWPVGKRLTHATTPDWLTGICSKRPWAPVGACGRLPAKPARARIEETDILLHRAFGAWIQRDRKGDVVPGRGALRRA